jgi:hypothetical protein
VLVLVLVLVLVVILGRASMRPRPEMADERSNAPRPGSRGIAD